MIIREGQILKGRYRVDKFLGRGGMAEVYKVWDKQRSTFLAMKLLYEDLAVDRVFIRRFKREANTLAKLQHPYIVRFYGLEQEGPKAFILLDYINGKSMKRVIFDQGGPFALEQIETIFHPICTALQYAHNKGLVHCDMKPGNVMVNRQGEVLVMDFGIARMTDAATATMVGMGTPAYMSPEQVLGLHPVPQTDIYALGILLFEMLTGGERPFTGEHAQTTGSTSEKVRWEQVNLPPPSPREYNPKITKQLESVLLKCLAKQPGARYQTPLELLNALERAAGGEKTAALEQPAQASKPKSVPAPTQGWWQRYGGLIGLGGIIVAGFVILFSGLRGDYPVIATTDQSAINNVATQTSTQRIIVSPTKTLTKSPPGIFTPTSTELLTSSPTTKPKQPTYTPQSTPTRTATSQPTATATAVPPPNDGLIAINSTRTGHGEIAVMNPDGSNFRQLTDHESYCDEPDFSPDGNWIVFERKFGQGYDWKIYIIGTDGRNEQLLVEGRMPAWSPDGQWIAFEDPDNDHNEQIWRMSTDGGNREQLTWDSHANRAPNWSPDGSKLAMMSKISGTWQILILDINTFEQKQITSGNSDKRFPVWSPDGKWIAYNTLQGGNPDQIWIVGADGGTEGQLTNSGSNGRPAWSPDSKYLLFNTFVGDEWKIARIGIDGSGYEILSRGGSDAQPNWAP